MLNTAAAHGITVRRTRDGDLPAITAIYAHAVRHGTASFETDPPDETEMARRRVITRCGKPRVTWPPCKLNLIPWFRGSTITAQGATARSCSTSTKRWRRRKDGKLMPNYQLQRTVEHRGRTVLAMDCALAGAEWQRWPAAEQKR